MLKRFNRLIFVLVIVALSLYVVILNRENITIFLSPSSSVTTSAGVVLIAVFSLGILCAATVATWFGVKAHFRERSLKSKEAQREAFYKDMTEARSLLACGEWTKAQERWQRILKREPNNIVARIELCRALENDGEEKEALKVIDSARSADPNNREVLFRAAELNIAQGNKTAAIDNLALILYQQPVKRAAFLARNLSEELERIEDAIEYHSQLEKLGEIEKSDVTLGRLRYKQLLRDHSESQSVLVEKLRSFVRSEDRIVAAWAKLSELERESGNTDAAAQALMRAARLEPSGDWWRKAMDIWVANGQPDRALAAARSGAKEAKGRARLEAELELIRLYVDLHMLEEAKAALSQFENQARIQNEKIDDDLARSYLSLQGLCLNNLGHHTQASEAWKKVVNLEFDVRSSHRETRSVSLNGEGPSPVLSTP